MEAVASSNRRERERVECMVTLTCRVPATPIKAQLVDISFRGCRLRLTDILPEPGSTLTLELSGGTRLAGEVVWTRSGHTGVRFHRPLSSRAAALLGLQLPGTTAPAKPEQVPQARDLSLGALKHWFRNRGRRLAKRND